LKPLPPLFFFFPFFSCSTCSRHPHLHPFSTHFLRNNTFFPCIKSPVGSLVLPFFSLRLHQLLSVLPKGSRLHMAACPLFGPFHLFFRRSPKGSFPPIGSKYSEIDTHTGSFLSLLFCVWAFSRPFVLPFRVSRSHPRWFTASPPDLDGYFQFPKSCQQNSILPLFPFLLRVDRFSHLSRPFSSSILQFPGQWNRI